jgi:glycogen debranching enzyme
VGMRAGLLGAQNGRFEAWVYPLKLLREFHLVFRTADGHEFAAESLARSITSRPESVTITYSADNFRVDETWFVPVEIPGAVVELEVETSTPLQIEARFRRDMQLMWPAGLGATWQKWDPPLHAFVFGEETRRYVGIVGAADADIGTQELETNYSVSLEDTLLLPTLKKGRGSRLIVIAGSGSGREEAERTYRQLLTGSASLRDAAASHYRDYLAQTTAIEVPDAEIQQAYDWARLSMAQGMVNDPLLGTGLVAGYRTSGMSARPGFAWFFGRDAAWTSLAMDSIGDFADVRTALEFLMKFQRADGKVEHEIAQTASLVPWFKDYPYAFASADATPLLLIAMAQYARASGDVAFVRAHWDNTSRAYGFLRSTWDAGGHPQNTGVGHGWIESGPLLPVKTELYQSGLGVQAVLSVAELARMANQPTAELQRVAEGQRKSLDHDFWSERIHAYAFALDKQNALVEVPSVLTTVPMWFGLLDPAHSEATIDALAGPDHMADWGMRIVSASNPHYDPSGYHYGSVWPLFTGWAAVGEYRYHRALPAFANLQANAQLTLVGAPGRTTEVLSGAYFDSLSTSSPHQIWSSAMVISPILRGMMGLDADAPAHALTFAPHVPAGWSRFSLRNVWVGRTRSSLSYSQTEGTDGETDGQISLEIDASGGDLVLHFSPAISLRAQVASVEIDGRPASFHLSGNSEDQHIEVDVPVAARASVRIRLRNDFDVGISLALPAPGQTSRGARVTSQSWTATHDELRLQISGVGGMAYDFPLRGAKQISRVEGASIIAGATGNKLLHVEFRGASDAYNGKTVVICFSR